MNADPHATTTLEGAVLHIRLNRPEKRNALTMAKFDALTAALQAAEADRAVGAIALSGEGTSFCAGHDLQAFGAWPQGPDDPVPRFLHALAALTKPFAVAVHGAAAGVGVTLLLHADWVCCAPDARLRLPFADLGIGPEAASSILLAQAVGSVRARRLLLAAEPFSGQQAYDWGLVSELVPESELAARLHTRAEQLASRSAMTMQLKDWLMPRASLHARIDDEIAFINDAIAKRPKAG